MSIPVWSLFLGTLLISMVLAGSLLPRVLVSNAMIYLCVGYVLGPGGLDLIAPDPFHYPDVLERIAEGALLISLFAIGLKMDVPLFDRRWVLPLRLAFISMAATVGLIAVVGVWCLGLPPGAAILLGAILAPTDPVLASGIHTEGGLHPDRLRFSLAGEGALNDGTAFPFVILGLGLLGLHDFDGGAWRWWATDVLWGTTGGLAIGAVLGGLIGRLVVHLRTRYKQAVGLDEFLSFGLIAATYGLAQICLASGFLAVFAAGLALQRVRERPQAKTIPLKPLSIGEHNYETLATHSHHASGTMTLAVQGFNEQMEKLAELAIVLLVGAMLPYVALSSELWWFVPCLFMLLRPLAVLIGTSGEKMLPSQRPMICWFGIRGIGSVYYLMYALHHGLAGTLSSQLVAYTLVAIVASIFLHGISVWPLMSWYRRHR